MSNELSWLLENEYLKGVGFALFGGFVRIYCYPKGSLNVKKITTGLLAASFVGIVFMECIQYYNINHKAVGLLTVLAGFLHKEMIDHIAIKFLLRIVKNGKL